MLLPLLLIPMVTVAAPGISSGIATLIGIGSGTGGAALGAGIWAFFTKSKKGPQLSQAHLASLDAQQQMTEERIRMATTEIQHLSQEASDLKIEVNEATNATSESVNHLQSVSQKIDETGQRLLAALTQVKESSLTLADSLPQLKEMVESFHLIGERAVKLLQESHEMLTNKVDALPQFLGDVTLFKSTIDDQTAMIGQLGNIVKTLIADNEDKHKVIEQKGHEIEQLKTVSIRLSQQNKFFKDALAQSTPSKTQAINVATSPL